MRKKARAAPVKSAKAVSEPSDLTQDFKRVVKASKATKLPGLEEGTSYGTPSLKVKGKFLLRVREPGVIAIMCSLEEKEFLMRERAAIYFETDHYKGYPAVLIRLTKIKDDELAHRIGVAWRLQAPKKLVASVGG
ncbi:MAG: MmcQ/YjbR family DNA-binding protein [Alphaproteobacteria bacterium]|nr:MmcQ/YjbR family DNA-binding protein [Alphaproteobacteria bacterium]